MSKKKIITIILIVVVILLGGGITTYFLTKNQKQETKITNNGYIEMNNLENAKIKKNKKYNISKEIKKEHNYEKYSFDNMKIYSNNGTSTIEFTITNLSGSDISEGYIIFIEFKDKQGELIYLYNYEVSNLKKGASKKEKIEEIPIDITNSYDYIVSGF